MTKAYAREREVAVDAVRRAAEVCRAVQTAIAGDVARGALQKDDRSPVTVADFASQALVCRTLLEEFPDDPVVGEEDAAALRRPDHAGFLEQVRARLEPLGGGSAAEILDWIDRGGTRDTPPRFWTLDPVDGTKGFLRGEQYAVALALLEDGVPVVAALACPNLPSHSGAGAPQGVAFVAVRGQGAVAEGLFGAGESRPIAVAEGDDPAAMAFCESVESGHSDQDQSVQVARILGITRSPVRLDSQAKYGVVARGEADVYLRLPTRKDYREKIWDHAAGTLVVQEAGGVVTDVSGAPLEFTHGRELTANRGVVVSRPAIHPRLLAALRQVGIGQG